jgi:hypothetical protein
VQSAPPPPAVFIGATINVETEGHFDMKDNTLHSDGTRGPYDPEKAALGDPMTTAPVRYHLTDELWGKFTIELVTKQIEFLTETGRYVLPPKPFTIRVSVDALCRAFGDTTPPRVPGHPYESFIDFDVAEEWVTLKNARRTHRTDIRPVDRQVNSDDYFGQLMNAGEKGIEGPWWEKDWICARTDLNTLEDNEDNEDTVKRISQLALWILIICLQDRSVFAVEVAPPKSKLCKLGIGKKRADGPPDQREIILYVPKRVYAGEHDRHGHHASPMMHFRAGHIRNQPSGPRAEPIYKQIVIDGMWVNGDPEPGTPIKMRSYKLVMAA